MRNGDEPVLRCAEDDTQGVTSCERLAARASWPVQISRLGDEPRDSPAATSDGANRLEMEYLSNMALRPMVVRRSRREEDDGDEDYARMSPAERLSMMWQLALDAWTFAGHDEPQSRLSRHLVVVQRRTR